MELRELSNGLRVALVPCEAESVAFGLFVGSGSRHERAREGGISHLIEHMLFKGTPRRTPLEITQAIEGRGGNFNAMTSEESTVYYAHLPYEYAGEAVDILTDMFLHASISEDEFVREREVVLDEIRMYADDPESVVAENLQGALFPRSRLGAPVAGGPKSLNALTPDDLRGYIRSHYRADNTVAVVAGRFDRERTMALLEKTLGALDRVRRRRPAAVERFGAPVASVSAAKDVQQTQLAIGYRTFGILDARKYAATVFDAVMGRGMSSRLFQEVREKRGLSYDISSRMQFFQDTGMWTVSAGVDPAKAALAQETIDRELRRICTRPVPADELRRTKEFLVGNFRLSHERVSSKMFYYGSTLLAFGRATDPEEQVAGVKAVTAADVREVARVILDPANRAVSRVVPKTPDIRAG